MLDRTVITALLDELGLERTQEICDVFIRDAKGRVEALQSALDRDDPGAAARAAHGLKSGCGFVGAIPLFNLCADIERTAGAGDLAFTRTNMAELRETLTLAVDELAPMVELPPSRS